MQITWIDTPSGQRGFGLSGAQFELRPETEEKWSIYMNGHMAAGSIKTNNVHIYADAIDSFEFLVSNGPEHMKITDLENARTVAIISKNHALQVLEQDAGQFDEKGLDEIRMQIAFYEQTDKNAQSAMIVHGFVNQPETYC